MLRTSEFNPLSTIIQCLYLKDWDWDCWGDKFLYLAGPRDKPQMYHQHILIISWFQVCCIQEMYSYRVLLTFKIQSPTANKENTCLQFGQQSQIHMPETKTSIEIWRPQIMTWCSINRPTYSIHWLHSQVMRNNHSSSDRILHVIFVIPYVVVPVNGLRLCLWTAAIKGPYTIWVLRTMVNW
jgi:hypothetical protein